MKKDGFISIDTVMSMSVVIIFILIAIAFYVYEYPSISLTTEVFTLSKVASEQGGLTPDDIASFKERIKTRKFVQDSPLEITVALIDEIGVSYTNVTTLNNLGTDYLKRQDLKVCTLIVKIPANTKMLNNMMIGINVSNTLGEYYVFEYPVVSKRY